MRTVAIHFDKDITLAEAQRAAAAIGCHLGIDRKGLITVSRAGAIKPQPLDYVPEAPRTEPTATAGMPFEIPSFLRPQAE